MPFVAEVSTLKLPGFDGGLNADADPFQLEPNEVPDCSNVDFGLRGAVSKRRGFTQYDSPALTPFYRKAVAWQKRGGSHFLVLVEDDEFRHGSGASFTQQTTTWTAPTADDDEYVGAVVFEDELFISSKNGNTYSFDGTTWTAITDSNLTGASPEFPQAAALETHYERVWAANLFNNSVEYASRVHYSNVGDAKTWDAADWIDVDPDDGYVITGLKVFGSNLMIFKETAVYALAGSDENTFSLYPLDRSIGTTAPETIRAEGDRLIFFDPLSGVWQFDGAGFDKLDDKINLYLLGGINITEAHKSSGFIWQGKYYLSVPWGSATEPDATFVIDLRTGAWTKYTYGARCWVNRVDDVYATGMRSLTGSDKAGVYTMFTGLNDDGSAIASHIETPWVTAENESRKHRLRRADFSFSALGNFNVTVEMRRDFDQSATVTKTINTDPGGFVWNTSTWGTVWGAGVDQVFKRETGWPYRWNTMQLRIEENTLTGDWQLNRVNLHISDMPRVRGEP